MECDGCTLCCKVLPIPWENSKAGEYCKHCSIGVGCSKFSEAQKDCISFKCVYNQLEKAPIELRPDKCNIIFEKVDNSLFLGTMHPDYNEAYKEEVIQHELAKFFERGFSVVINSFTLEKPIIYPSKDREASEVWTSLQKQSKEKYGSTFIHD